MHTARVALFLLPLATGVILLGAVTAPQVSHAQGVPGMDPNECLAGKTKCVNKRVEGLLKCRTKCQRNPARCGPVQIACETKVMDKFDGGATPAKSCFARLEAKDNPLKPDSVCMTTGDTSSMEALTDTLVGDVVATLEGNPPPTCGDAVVNAAESCDGLDLDGATCASQGFASGPLACTTGCGFDTSGCTCGVICGMCGNGTAEGDEQCDGTDLGGENCVSLGYQGGTLACEVATCGFDTSGCASQASPATGQATCYDGDGNVVACAGTGQDGDVQAGATLAYQDNGNGTITDLNTLLTWEKKSDDGTLDDWNNCYPWSGLCSGDGTTTCGRDADCAGAGGTCDVEDCQHLGSPTGTTIFEWVDALNAASFAGYTDWRVPNLREVQSIENYETTDPATSAAFHTGCTPGCTVTACSCTRSSFYWTSTSFADTPRWAWYVHFSNGDHSLLGKSSFAHVRAVRGGF